MNEPAYQYTTAEQVLEPNTRYPRGIKLHELAFSPSEWGRLDPRVLTEEMLLRTNEEGDTVAHRLAWHVSLFNELPPRLITPRVLMARDRRQNTVLHILTREYGDAEVYLANNSRHPDHVSPLLTVELLLAANRDGDTVLHFLASKGLFNKKVKSLLTPEMLMTRNRHHGTVIERAAANGGKGLRAVARLITRDMLMEGTYNESVLVMAVRTRILHLIQPSAFRPGWLNRKFRGRTLAQILVEDYAKKRMRRNDEFEEKIRTALINQLLTK
jgi:hypothetical protein